LSSVEEYDPGSGSWSQLTSLSTRRSGVSAVALGDKIYVLGGFDGAERSGLCFLFLYFANCWVLLLVPRSQNVQSTGTITVILVGRL